MTKIYWSDLAAIPADVCPSSLDENLKPFDASDTAHKWDVDSDPVACAECGVIKECSNAHGHFNPCDGTCPEPAL